MPDNKFVLDKIEFEKQIAEMPEKELLKFTARLVYDLNTCFYNHNKRITELESTNKKMFGISGGIGGGIALGIQALINYIFNR